MKYLVTGATGFTGGTLLKKLLKDGHEVRVLIRNPEKKEYFINQGAEVATGDLREPDNVFSAVKGVDGIFHIAAAFRAAGLPDQTYWDINVTGTQNIMEAALKTGVRRVIHCSTIGVHGHVKEPPANEESAFNPGDIYQETKLAGEQCALLYFRKHALPVTVIRPAGIYGPGDLRFLKLFSTIKSGRFIMLGSGEIYFHPVFIDDLVNGFQLAMEKDSAPGQIFIIAGPGYITLNKLVNTIADTLEVSPPKLHIPVAPVKIAAKLCEALCKPFGVEPPLYPRRVDFFTKCRAFDISKAKNILGYNPKISLREGIRRTAKWYIKENLL